MQVHGLRLGARQRRALAHQLGPHVLARVEDGLAQLHHQVVRELLQQLLQQQQQMAAVASVHAPQRKHSCKGWGELVVQRGGGGSRAEGGYSSAGSPEL